MDHYIAGTLAGIAGTIVSHPFFTLKVCLQNNDTNSIMNNLSQSKNLTNKLNWLYRGVSPAIIGYSIEKSLVFGTFNHCFNALQHYNLPARINAFISGFLAGIVASFSITYFEQMTISIQQNISKRINFQQFYAGLFPTMMREAIGFSIYFSVYNYLTNKYNPTRNLCKTALIGVPSIISAWIVITPIDKIKTNIQSNKKISMTGFWSMYRGFRYVMLRAIPFHTTCFVVFEFAMKHLSKYEQIATKYV